MCRSAIIASVCAVSLSAGLPLYGKKNAAADPDRSFEKAIPKNQRIEQALNRLTFGPRPGDEARVQSIGLKKWIDLQLHPNRIQENPELLEKLQVLDSLSMSSRDLVRNYPSPQMARQILNGTLPYPADPDRRLMIEKLAARLERRQQGGQAAAVDLATVLSPAQLRSLRNGTPEQKLAAFEELPVSEQNEVILDLPPGILQNFSVVAPPPLRRKLELAAGPQLVVARDLSEGKLLRATGSNRQLQEVLVDFWFNHFNVFLDKGADHYLVTAYERDAIRPHVLGKFRDLLEATAKSPAMLFYLDNWQSRADTPARGRAPARRGLNENYGRELMELHTLGVNAGYTQKDVIEVARCFTGWTIRQPQQGGEFYFDPKRHDRGAKVVLGITIPAGGGIEDGEKVLDILARHPATAHFISKELAMRFVADNPPAPLVDQMAHTFLKSGGDLRAVMKTMIQSKEFWSVGAYRSKMKSPLEMVASAVRAVNGDVGVAFALDNQVTQMGEPLYRKQEPTGYSNSGKEWLNSADLLARLNFAWNLAHNRVPGVTVAAADGADPAESPTALMLGSPEFQRH